MTSESISSVLRPCTLPPINRQALPSTGRVQLDASADSLARHSTASPEQLTSTVCVKNKPQPSDCSCSSTVPLDIQRHWNCTCQYMKDNQPKENSRTGCIAAAAELRPVWETRTCVPADTSEVGSTAGSFHSNTCCGATAVAIRYRATASALQPTNLKHAAVSHCTARPVVELHLGRLSICICGNMEQPPAADDAAQQQSRQQSAFPPPPPYYRLFRDCTPSSTAARDLASQATAIDAGTLRVCLL